jgi:hypothetical protein
MSHLTLKKALFIVAVVCILFSGWIRYAQVANYNFPFTTDQARDMIDLRDIVVGINPTLVGPTTSINGVRLGPGYYYFNVVPFVIGQGDPAFLVYWNLLFYLIAAVLLLLLHTKKEVAFGFFASILFICAPGYFQATRYFWNAHAMPYFTVAFFIALYFFLRNPSVKKAILVGLSAGIGLQFEAAFGILFMPFALLISGFFYKKIDWKLFLYQIFGFCLTLVPQILFELKNNFAMTQIFISEVTGDSQILGEKLSFTQSILNHINSYIQFSHGVIALPYNLDSIVLIAAILFLGLKLYQKKLDPDLKIYFLISLGFLIFSFLFYTLYHYPLKSWYILGLRVPYILLIATFLTAVYNHLLENKSYRHLPKTVTIAVILISVGLSFLDQKQFIPTNDKFRSDDKSNLRNSIEAIDWVYEKTQGRGFKAYNYIPSVYDFPYQYLYWWHGTKTYGYQPEIITYKDNVPEYIPNNKQFLTKTKSQEDNLIAMIYEDDESMDRIFAWGGNFTKYCRVTDIKYSWGTTVEIRQPCLPGEDSPRLEPARR